MASPLHGAAAMPTFKRRCPKCGHTQAVSVLLQREKVVCRRCGAMIPAGDATPAAGAHRKRAR